MESCSATDGRAIYSFGRPCVIERERDDDQGGEGERHGEGEGERERDREREREMARAVVGAWRSWATREG